MKTKLETITAKDLMAELDNGCVVLINVLDAISYIDCHIRCSKNIPVEDLEKIMELWDRKDKIVVYCASVHCHASHKAYEILVNKMHFKNVKAYEGGMKEWHDLKYPSEGACQMKYLYEK